jgi:VWFA-related protein
MLRIPPGIDMFPLRALQLMHMDQETTVDTMKGFADATGGEAFYDRNDIDTAMKEAIADAHANYTIGFYLPDADADGTFHKLRVLADRRVASLQYRQGYFAGGEAPWEGPPPTASKRRRTWNQRC